MTTSSSYLNQLPSNISDFGDINTGTNKVPYVHHRYSSIGHHQVQNTAVTDIEWNRSNESIGNETSAKNNDIDKSCGKNVLYRQKKLSRSTGNDKLYDARYRWKRDNDGDCLKSATDIEATQYSQTTEGIRITKFTDNNNVFNCSHETASISLPDSLATLQHEQHTMDAEIIRSYYRPVVVGKTARENGELTDNWFSEPIINFRMDYSAAGWNASELLERGDTRADVDLSSIAEELSNEYEPGIDIRVNNVVGHFDVGCKLNLQQIGRWGVNVIYRRDKGVASMRLRKPPVTASIWASGKVLCTGAGTEYEARIGSRRVARSLHKLNFPCKFLNFKIVNILATCNMPFGILITQLAQRYVNIKYDDEKKPGAMYRSEEYKCTCKIYSTGNITIMAPSLENIKRVIQEMYPLVRQFRTDPTFEQIHKMNRAEYIKNSKCKELFHLPIHSHFDQHHHPLLTRSDLFNDLDDSESSVNAEEIDDEWMIDQ